MAHSTCTLMDLPRGCDLLAAYLKTHHPHVTPVFKGRAGASLWVRAVDSLQIPVPQALKRAVDAGEGHFTRRDRCAQCSAIEVTLVGFVKDEARSGLLQSIFDTTPTRSCPDPAHQARLNTLKVDKPKELSVLRSAKGSDTRFHYSVRFEDDYDCPAYHLRSPVQLQEESLKLAVEDPPYIAAETLRSLISGPLWPHSDLIAWDTLIVLHRIYLFTSENKADIPHESGDVAPFDPSRLRRAFEVAETFSPPAWIADGVHADTLHSTLLRRMRDRERMETIPREDRLWKSALEPAVKYFCGKMSVFNDFLGRARDPQDENGFPLWPRTLSNFTPIERDPSPEPIRRPRRDSSPPPRHPHPFPLLPS